MKHVKTFLVLMLVTVLTFSCDKDDDGDLDVNQSDLVGSWLLTGSKINGEASDISDLCDFTLDFTESTLTITDIFGENCEEVDRTTYDYSVDDGLLTIEDGNIPTRVRITTLNSTTLRIIFEDSGDEYEDTFTSI